MERQCRVCFDTDETSPFLTPCACRGTQAYIHTDCLTVYLQHYPDGICRVCRVQMAYHSDVAFLYGVCTAAWMMAIGYAATLPSEPRGMYLTLAGGFLVYCFLLRRLPILIGVIGMMLSSAFLYASPEALFWTLTGCAAGLTALVLWMYIPITFLLVGTVIIAGAFYSVMLLLIALSRNNPAGAAMLLCLIMFVWYLVIRARPPQRIL